MRRTTLVFDDDLWKEMRKQAAEAGSTVSGWVAGAVRQVLRSKPKRNTAWRLQWTTRPMGLKDIRTREAMYKYIPD